VADEISPVGAPQPLVADGGCRRSLTAVNPLLGWFDGTSFSARKTERFLQLLHHLIHNRASKCSLDHRQGTDHEIRLVEIRISAAFGRTVFIDAAKIILQERAGSGSSLPGIVTVGVRAFQVCLDKFLALHSETLCHQVNLLFAERWRHPSTAVGTGGAVDPGPHTPSNLKDALVDLVRVQIALSLQEPAKVEILIFSRLG